MRGRVRVRVMVKLWFRVKVRARARARVRVRVRLRVELVQPQYRGGLHAHEVLVADYKELLAPWLGLGLVQGAG